MPRFRVVGENISESPFAPDKHTIPNTIFVAVTNHTSALYEGIIRGIHGILIRDKCVNYAFSPMTDSIPTFSVAEAVEHIIRCGDPLFYDEAWRSQREIFLDRTQF